MPKSERLVETLTLGQRCDANVNVMLVRQPTITLVWIAPWVISVQEFTLAIPSLLRILETSFRELRPLAWSSNSHCR